MERIQRARLGRHLPFAGLLAAGALGRMFADGEPEVINDTTIDDYRTRQAAIAQDSQALLAKLDAEAREPNAEELRTLNENTSEVERLQNLIETRSATLRQIRNLAKGQGRQTTPTAESAAVPANSAARDRGAPNLQGQHARTRGFGHFGEFSMAVLNASIGRGEMDQRLKNAAATTIATEAVGSDGGFLVPPEFRERILAHVFDENDLLARTDQQITSRNSITFPVDETVAWGSNGVRVFWESEAAAINQSRPVFREMTLKTNKLAALVPVTEELLEDAPGLGNYLDRVAGRGMNYAVSNSILDGTGVGQPLGILRSGSLVTVAAEGGQAADTVNVQNVAKIWTRMPARSRASAIWLMNPDVEAQFITMTLGGTSVAIPVYMPPNGLSQSPFGTILGRPAIPHMACKAIGDTGDLVFADLSQYVTAVKTGGMRSDVSMHLWFDQDIAAFKFTMRVDGRPWASQAITPPNGSSTLSPFVALAPR